MLFAISFWCCFVSSTVIMFLILVLIITFLSFLSLWMDVWDFFQETAVVVLMMPPIISKLLNLSSQHSKGGRCYHQQHLDHLSPSGVQQKMPKSRENGRMKKKKRNIRVFPKIWGFPPKSSILRSSIINHPFWGTTIFGNIHTVSFGWFWLICPKSRALVFVGSGIVFFFVCKCSIPKLDATICESWAKGPWKGFPLRKPLGMQLTVSAKVFFWHGERKKFFG